MDTKTKMTGLKDTIQHFAETTSIKGIPRALKSSNTVIKVLWILALITGCTYGGWQAFRLISLYLDYGYQTRYSECTNCSPPFPDITICNLNPSRERSTHFPGFTMFEFSTWYQYIERILLPKDLFSADELRHQVLGELSSFSGFYQNMYRYMKDFSTLCNQTVVDCKWHGWNWAEHPEKNCTLTGVSSFFSPEFHYCITFHAGQHMGPPQKDVRGLTAILYLDDFSDAIHKVFLSDLTHPQSHGLRVVVHEPGILPDIKLGFNVPAGHDISVQLTLVEKGRLHAPHFGCTNQTYLEDHVREGGLNYVYSYIGCMNMCHQRAIIERCGCVSGHIPFLQSMLENYTFCSDFVGLKFKEDFDTNDLVIAWKKATCAIQFNTSTMSCNCLLECQKKEYYYDLYPTEWPHPSYDLAFYIKHIKDKPWGWKFDAYSDILYQLESGITDRQGAVDACRQLHLIKRNFVQLNIHFPMQSVWHQDDVPTVSADQLTAQIAAILNLWMGISFITAVELAELVCRTIIVQYYNWKKNVVAQVRLDSSGKI